MRRWWSVCLVLILLPAMAAAEGSGIYGRAAWRGQLVPGVIVWAYRDADGHYLSGEAFRSEPVGVDGSYRLPLPPGRYTLVARGYRDGGDGRPREGDYYCYYSGSPVVVPQGGWVPVGFNMVRYAAEKREPAERTSMEGVVTYQGKPLEKLYLYLYREAGDGFRGPGLATLPVGTGGRFRAALSPGTYFVIARKRMRGGMYGPMEIGDYFNYYPGNPVVVREGERVTLSLETVTRISQLEEGEQKLPEVAGLILDRTGKPVRGVRVFAYTDRGTTGRPLYFSEPSGDDGRFSLPIPEPGSYSLMARERFGGPASSGEYSGRYDDGDPVEVGTGGLESAITIRVEREP